MEVSTATARMEKEKMGQPRLVMPLYTLHDRDRFPAGPHFQLSPNPKLERRCDMRLTISILSGVIEITIEIRMTRLARQPMWKQPQQTRTVMASLFGGDLSNSSPVVRVLIWASALIIGLTKEPLGTGHVATIARGVPLSFNNYWQMFVKIQALFWQTKPESKYLFGIACLCGFYR